MGVEEEEECEKGRGMNMVLANSYFSSSSSWWLSFSQPHPHHQIWRRPRGGLVGSSSSSSFTLKVTSTAGAQNGPPPLAPNLTPRPVPRTTLSFALASALLLAVALPAHALGLTAAAAERRHRRKYSVTLEFPFASGINIGTPVRMRGVDIATVVSVTPSLERIDVSVLVRDESILIPQNAHVEVNQSGLASETVIDITPRVPLPQPLVGPLDASCQKEGLIACDKGRLKGEQGVCLDELIGLCTKMARVMKESGVNDAVNTLERLSVILDDTKPLLSQVESAVAQVKPAVKELKGGMVLKDMEALIGIISRTVNDVRSFSLTSEDTKAVQDSIDMFTKNLKNLQKISEDASSITGDPTMQHNLKQLIETLSRLVL